MTVLAVLVTLKSEVQAQARTRVCRSELMLPQVWSLTRRG